MTDNGGADAPDITAPKTSAAGLPAVLWAARHARSQMGVVRSLKTMLAVNQADGFDCPGCAWPEPADRSRFEFCENGAKAVAEEATRRRVGAGFFATHSLADLAVRDDHWLGRQGRLTVPAVRYRGSDRYRAVSWEEAIRVVGDGLRMLRHADEAAFYTSGRTSNEAAFAYQLFVRLFGTNNLPDCSNMCHESTGVALTETLGVGTGSVTLDDIHTADLIFVVGQNPGTNHPRMLSALERAKQAGATIVAVNPLPEAGLLRFKNPQRPGGVLGGGTQLADRFVRIRSNGDLALFQLLSHALLIRDQRGEGVLDWAFVNRYCDGFEEFAEALGQLPVERALAAAGVDAALVEELVALVTGAGRIIVCWAMGVTQHRNSVATIREIVNFLLLRGNIGRPGAGVCPVRGHSNVQGDRRMGIHERPTAAFLDALAAEFGFQPPRQPGLDTVDTIRALRDGQVKAFVALGGNFAAATPDSAVTAAALEQCSLTVQISTKLNRSHVVCGETAVILPCLGRTERDERGGRVQLVSVEDSMGLVHGSVGTLEPAAPDLPSEVAIICRLARAVLATGRGPNWEAWESDYSRIRASIARVIPGFADYDRRVRGGGFALAHPVRDSRIFPTATGRARLSVNPLDVVDIPPGRLLLQTLRSHDQYNTTIYGLDDRYRGIRGGRRVVFAHPDDLAGLGFADGDVVDVVSHWHDGRRRAGGFRLVAYPAARGTCAAYFPEANVLVPLDSVAEDSQTPTFKSIIVSFERACPSS